ncbi:MAG: ATP-binding cassette domain-containing protein [Anaerolineales bacterium]|nr:ATP-binding cassette domain-containing protein [Anaerolineales bacterium]
MNVIETKGLCKSFRSPLKKPGVLGAVRHLFRPEHREIVAVTEVDLAIAAGESVAYVGPNGAGKSTTIKMLTGILLPTGGEVRVNGLHPYHQRMRNSKNIGVVFGQRTQLWWDIPVIESFTLLRDIYEVPEKTYAENLAYFTGMLGLAELLHQSARRLSLGQRMRCDLAVALMHNPAIVFLDEPTIGLDVAVKERIREFLKTVNRERGVTIMLTSHDLGDIEDVCRRLIIIDAGRIIYDGSIQGLLDRYVKQRSIRIIASARIDQPSAARAMPAGVEIVHADEREMTVEFDRFRYTAKDVLEIIMTAAEVVDFQLEEPDIERVVKNVYEGRLELEQGA